MNRLLVSLLLCVASPLLQAQAATPETDDATFASRFRHVLDESGIPGGAYAIVRDGRIVHAAGHGVRALGSGAPVTADTVFRIASVSKTFAAQLAALLVHEGSLRWDDGVNTFLPAFQLKRAGQAQRLQLQHLLGQSTGIVSNAYDNLLEANEPLARVLPLFRELEPICPPGQCYTYQNILFALIEPAVERVTRRSYNVLVQERLFQPLQMQHASIGMDAFLAADNRALPHVRRNGAWQPTDVEPGYYQVPPAAGVNASATDLGKWLIAQMGDRPDIVPPQLVDELTRKRIRTQKDLRRRSWRDLLTDAHYGLGWRIYQIGDEELYYHGGWVEGFVADVAYSRDRRIGLVVLLNAESAAINEITTTFWKQVLSHDATATAAGAD